MSVLSDNRIPALQSVQSYAATDAKRHLGEVLDRVMIDGLVNITRHGRQKISLIPAESLEALIREVQKSRERELSEQCDTMLEAMQTDTSIAAASSLFEAEGDALGRVAVEAAKTRE
mgnify:CR=1 FL=1